MKQFLRSLRSRRHSVPSRRDNRLAKAVLETLESRRLLTAISIDNPSFENPSLSDGQTSASVPS